VVKETLGGIVESIKTLAIENLSHYKLKQHKLWADEQCSELMN
jgi:hypothetical protein